MGFLDTQRVHIPDHGADILDIARVLDNRDQVLGAIVLNFVRAFAQRRFRLGWFFLIHGSFHTSGQSVVARITVPGAPFPLSLALKGEGCADLVACCLVEAG